MPLLTLLLDRTCKVVKCKKHVQVSEPRASAHIFGCHSDDHTVSAAQLCLSCTVCVCKYSNALHTSCAATLRCAWLQESCTSQSLDGRCMLTSQTHEHCALSPEVDVLLGQWVFKCLPSIACMLADVVCSSAPPKASAQLKHTQANQILSLNVLLYH